MVDADLLNAEERKDKIRAWTLSLSRQFNQLLWDHPAKLKLFIRLKPHIVEEFWKHHDELDIRFAEYLEGKIDWGGDTFQMEFSSIAKIPYPVLEIDRDIANYSRELYAWLVLQINGL